MANAFAPLRRMPLAPSVLWSGPGAIAQLGELLRTWGGPVLILTGTRAYRAARPSLEAALGAAGIPWEVALLGGECSEAAIGILQGLATRAAGIVGVGGGKVLDAAKLLAQRTGVPVVTVPTAAATCAAMTALSNVYAPEGRWLHGVALDRCPEAVVVDHELLAAAPPRLVAAGIADAMAKWIESSASVDLATADLFTRAAVEQARLIFDRLHALGPRAVADAAHHRLTPALTEAIDAAVGLAGTVGGLGGARCRSVVAHAVANALTATRTPRATLHGEKVAYGMLVQRALQGASELELQELAGTFAAMRLPLTLATQHVRPSELAMIARDVARPDSCAHLIPGITEANVLRAIARVEALSTPARTRVMPQEAL